MQNKKNVKVCVYHGESVNSSEILKKAQDRFGIKLNLNITFIALRHRFIIEEKTWKHFTLLGQALGSIILANEALNQIVPDIFIDTHGLGFCYGWIKLMTSNTRVISYTHYPFI